MILDDIVAYKKIQVEEEKRIFGEGFVRSDETVVRDFKGALGGGKEGIAIIGEIKKASPSKGIIIEDFDPQKIARLYEKAGIDAISVLTERQFFKGRDGYIKIVKEVSNKPVLRKDFIIDEFQIFQARAIGADAILLIEEILGNSLNRYYSLAREIGLQCLVEVHSERALSVAMDAGCDIIGINNRDLRDFSVDLKTTERLIKSMPSGVKVVSESGIKNTEDIRYLSSIGVSGVLIGETFMRNIHDISKIKDFVYEAKCLRQG
jgi:indole-3-glycerol phosphate synthase